MYRSYVMICGGPNCTLLAGRQEKLAEEFEVQLKLAGLRKEVQVMRGGCLGLCSSGPNVAVFPEGTIYSHVHVEDVAEIVSEHLLKGGRVDRLLYNENEATSTVRSLEETEFYKKQLRIALRNCGVIDPQNIDEYIARDGYAALEKCLTELTPDEVIQIVLDSGLRGRGGAGFPTGLKWRFASGERGQVQKYVCCNADEGDPGAFMDRSVLEGDPHSIIEAMAIAGYAIGASQGYIYVRAEYPIAVKHLQIALEQARSYGLLGEDIFGTGFSFDLEIKLGAGGFRMRGRDRPDDLHRRETGRAPAPAALPGGEGLVPAAHHPKQRGDLRQHLPHHSAGGGVVLLHRQREEQGDQGICPGRAYPEHRPGGGAHGHHPAHYRGGDRGRHPPREEIQGRPDRRPLRRMHPRGAHRHPYRLRQSGRHRDHDGLRGPDRDG